MRIVLGFGLGLVSGWLLTVCLEQDEPWVKAKADAFRNWRHNRQVAMAKEILDETG